MGTNECVIHTSFVINGLAFDSLDKMVEIEERIQAELSYFVKERMSSFYTTIECNYTIERISQMELLRSFFEDSTYSALIRELHLTRADIYRDSIKLNGEEDPYFHFSNFTVKLKINACQESNDNKYDDVIKSITGVIDAYINFNRIMLHKNYKVKCINYNLNSVGKGKMSFSQTGTFPIGDYSIMSSKFNCYNFEKTVDLDMVKYIHFLNSISDDSIGFVRLIQATYDFSDMLLNITLIITTFVNLISLFEEKIGMDAGLKDEYNLYFKQYRKKYSADRSKVTSMVKLHSNNDIFPNSKDAFENIEFAYKLRNNFAHGSNGGIKQLIKEYKKDKEWFNDVSNDYILDNVLLHISRNLIYMYSWLNT